MPLTPQMILPGKFDHSEDYYDQHHRFDDLLALPDRQINADEVSCNGTDCCRTSNLVSDISRFHIAYKGDGIRKYNEDLTVTGRTSRIIVHDHRKCDDRYGTDPRSEKTVVKSHDHADDQGLNNCFFRDSVLLLSCFSLAISTKILFGSVPMHLRISFTTFNVCQIWRFTAGETYKFSMLS